MPSHAAQPVVARDRLPRRESEALVVAVDSPACRVWTSRVSPSVFRLVLARLAHDDRWRNTAARELRRWATFPHIHIHVFS